MSLLASSSVSVINVNDGATGATGPQGISVTKVVEEYRLSNSKTELTGSGTGYTWSETKPSIPAGKYLWIRERTDLSNNQSSYGSAHCDIVTSGLVQDVDRNSGVITSKVWESYTSSYVNEYDGTTGKAIRDRVSKTETDINGITSRVSDVESETDDLGTRMTSAESSITQNANNIELKVSKDGVISSINQSAETVKIEASKVDIEGAVTFSSFDSTLQNRLTTAESDASTAKSNASSAVSTANTASSNASSALTKVNNSIKSTTMHYLATSASSGVTTSTSGWTTSIQTITTSKPYLWTYQTVTKVDNTTYNTDPVISGVYGNTGGKGDTGVGVSKVEQLYRTSNSTTAPAAPTSKVTSTSTAANTWTLAMPTYGTSYPYYYICTQTTYDNGTVKWTSVSRSSALEDANKTAATANTNASAAVSTANTANTNASTAVSTANTAKSTADTAKSTADAAKSKADSAASLLSTWTGDATLATTTINGGYIKTHTIESTHLATDAIMSSNYQASSDASSSYSATGAFLDLSTGNLYMPNFGVNGTTGAAYFNGTVNANAGKFGDDSSYWNIETVYDYDMQPHAALVGTGSPYLQTGNWQVSDNAVATRKYTSTSDSSGKATYYKDSGTNTFYDVGMKIPSNFSAYSASDSSVTKYNKAFYYGRKYTSNNVPSLDSDWTYFFSIDSGGNVITAGDVYEGGVKLSDKYAAITDVGSAYLPKTGGTITGNLSVNGSFTTNLQVQTNLASTSAAQLTGNANAVVKPGVTGTLGVGNGGTGQTTAQNAANAFINALSTGSTTSMLRDADYFISQYIGGGTSNTKYYRRPISTIWDYIEDKIETTYDITNTYRRLDNNDFDTINVTDLTAGNLIVNGAARFTNDVFADTFTGNLVGTASSAVEFSSNQSLSLTGDTTGSASSKAGWSVTTTTNKLTYQPQLTTQAAIDGFIEASKFMVATFKTTDANNIGMASNDGMIMSLAWQSTAYGAQLALDDITTGVLKIRGRANSVWGDWRTVIHDGNYTNYTVTKTGTGASGTWGISISGNAATASSAATATKATQDSVGNQINTYYTPISYMPHRSGRDFVDGTLIVTNLSGGTTSSSIPFLLKIIGNGYNNGFVEVYVQGYVYNLDNGYTKYISTDAFSNSKTFTSKIYAFKNSEGYLSFWFERMGYWQGFDVQCYDTSENMHTTKTVNHVTSVTNSALPSTRSYTTEIDVRQGLSSSNYHNYTVKKDGTGATGTWGINVTGTASKLATARTISLTGSVTGSVSFDGSGDVSIATTTNHTHNYAGSNSAGGALSTGVAWAAGTDNAARRVWFSNTNSTNTVAYPVYDDDFKYNPSTNVLTVGSISGSAAYLTTGRTLTIGNTGKTFNGSSDVSWTKADISANATTSANGWMSSDDKTKLNGIQAGAQVNTITGVKGGSETDYRTGNVNITASNIGLGNVTNNKQVKGLASGTTSGHLVSWGSDGYTVADSGLTATSVATKITLAGSDYSASSNTITITQANLQSAVQSTGLLLMTSAERSKLASIQVSEGGTIDFSGVTASTPLTATVGTNKTVNITHNTSGVTAGTYRSVTVNAYGHVTAGTNPTTLSGYGITDAKIASGVITLGSNTITPLTASSTLDATKLSGTASISTTGNAGTATKFASAQSITLTGDTTGTASSQAGWSVATTTTRLSTVGDKRSEETTPNSYANKLIFQGLKGKSTIGSPSNDTYSYLIGLRGWSDSSGGKAHELAFNDSGINHRSGSTTTWDAWEKLVTSANYTDYTVTKTGTGASGTWGISISGNATTATKFASNQSVTLTGDVTGTASSQAGWSISTTLSNSGVTADSYGPSANASPSHGGTFSVPYITVDAKGRITSASTKTITLPSSGNTDTKVTQTAVTASSYTYWRPLIFGHSNSATEGFSPSTVTDQVYATSTLSVQPSSGTIRATIFKGNLSGNATTATTATYSNYPNLVSGNEIRFNNKPSDATDIHIGYKWADGTADAKINSYRFENGNTNNLANVYAATFYGALSGNASTATKWSSAQTVYVALGTASKTTSIQGGSSSAVTLGVDGVLGVANGGTGAASFTANSVIMSGSSTTGAFTTRAVTNNTSASAVTANTNLITANTLAYWTGSSNLTTCSQGTFGTAATYSATTSVTSGSGALITSGGVSTALGSYVTLSTTQTISGTKTFSAATSFTNTTASTSKSTGAVKVSGGLGVAGQVSANTAMIGDAVSLVYDSSISALCFQFA